MDPLQSIHDTDDTGDTNPLTLGLPIVKLAPLAANRPQATVSSKKLEFRYHHAGHSI